MNAVSADVTEMMKTILMRRTKTKGTRIMKMKRTMTLRLTNLETKITRTTRVRVPIQMIKKETKEPEMMKLEKVVLIGPMKRIPMTPELMILAPTKDLNRLMAKKIKEETTEALLGLKDGLQAMTTQMRETMQNLQKRRQMM